MCQITQSSVAAIDWEALECYLFVADFRPNENVNRHKASEQTIDGEHRTSCDD